jgi:hypothetical protein
MTPDLPATVTIPESVAWQQVGDEVVLLNVDSSEYHNLNDVGSRMWQVLEESADVATAYQVLCDTYEVSADRLRDELGIFIRELMEKGLLTTP